MTAATVDQLVDDYLSRLETAAADLPVARRIEILSEIREHIETARSEGVAANEASTRTMLDQLGEPEEIAAAARAESYDIPAAPTQPTADETGPCTRHELAAVLLLTIGSLIPFVGWAVGVVLLWTSRRWTIGEKIVGTLIVPTGPGGVLLLGFTPFVPGWAGGLIFATLLIAPIVVASLLYSLARMRSNTEPHQHNPSDSHTEKRIWTGTEIAAVTLLGVGPVFALMLTVLLGTPIAAPVALLAGLPFVWASTQWTQHEKQVGTAIAATPILAAFLFLLLVEGSV